MSAAGTLRDAMRSLRLAVLLSAFSLDAACAPPAAPITPAARETPPREYAAEPALSHAGGASTAPPVAEPSAPVGSTVPLPNTPSSSAPTQAPVPAFQETLDAATKAIGAGDFVTADRHIDAAAKMGGEAPHLEYLVARLRATRFVYAGDFEHAAEALVAVIPVLAKHPELADEFWAHNAMMMIREAQGDPAAALAENDQATLSGTRWAPGTRRACDARLPEDRWHRAYLTRMLAESRAGSVKEALVQYARAALDDVRGRGGSSRLDRGARGVLRGARRQARRGARRRPARRPCQG